MTTDATDTARAEPDNRTYGLHVWRCARDGAWRMDGIYGQFGIMLPAHRATVSITAHYQGPTTQILDCVWEHIVPALAWKIKFRNYRSRRLPYVQRSTSEPTTKEGA